MADSTLAAIRIKVRRLTRSLSEAQLSTAQIDEYINTFVLYDFPEHLRLFNLRTTFQFFTEPFIDEYESNDDVDSPLFEFTQRYITVHPPIYIAGYEALFLEDRAQFFGIYPKINSIASIGVTGDGATIQFTGVINTQQANVPPNLIQNIVLLRNNVLFSSLNTAGDGLAMIDHPINATQGNLFVPNEVPAEVLDPNNNINYTTGQFIVTFQSAPANGAPINSQTVMVQPSLPQSLLFFDGKFTVRPVPDQPYRIQMEVYARPTELLEANQSPLLQEWWQYIAYGASKKVFEDRMDLESVQQIMAEFKKQENLIQRRTIVQQTSQRVASIYTEQSGASGAYGAGWFSGGGSF